MTYLAIGLFALAAIIGVIILKNWLTAAKTSRTVVYAHGIFAALGLVMLVMMVMNDPSKSLKTSLALFGVAAIGGFYMFFQGLKGKFSPIWLAVTHALIAVAGFGILLWTII